VRLCTEPYVAPNGKNMSQTCMHLTNYAINKHSSNFVFNDDAERTDIGHKRSIQWLFTYLDEHGCNAREVWDRIGDMITKTLIAGQPALQHAYRASVSADDDGYTCFEVLGFDIMLDSKLRPWLIEVNHSPNFTCDTPFDMKIKSTLVRPSACCPPSSARLQHPSLALSL
jgi:tubulin polyglutamylase TTLL6/13